MGMTVVIMIWGFWDESGEHDKTSGHLVRLTIGGAFASSEAWESFSMGWAALLQWAGIAAFHMTDFEAHQPPYDEWSECKGRRFLNTALETMAAHIDEFHGFTNRVTAAGDSLRETYEAGMMDTILHAARGGAYGGEPIALVFAKHPEFRPTSVRSRYEQIKQYYDKVCILEFSDPAFSCPLQAADIIAYEVRSLQREDGSPTNRYPLRRLKELGALLRFSSDG
jgi:hypothetical protein